MITHEIVKYSIPRTDYGPPPGHYHVPSNVVPHTVTRDTPKVVYAQWIERQKLTKKPGEYVMFYQNTFNPAERQPWHYHRIVQWQEVQMFLTYDENGNACALEIVNNKGDRMWVNGNYWHYCHPPIEAWAFSCPQP